MANWVVESGDFTLDAGQSTAGITHVDLTISNVVNGVWSGSHLSAENFKIGEATKTVGTYTWVGGNVDTVIDSVTFSDLGIAGDPANTVKARVAILSGYSPSITPATLYVDIDEITAKPVRPRTVYLSTSFSTYAAGQTIVADLSGGWYTESGLTYTPGSVVGLERVDLVTGTVSKAGFSTVGSILFSAAAGYFYKREPSISFSSLGDYEGDYFATITPVKTGGVITAFLTKIFYQPNPLGGFSNEELRQYGHTAFIDYELQAESTAVSNTITGLSYKNSAPYMGGNQSLAVLGTANSVYTIGIHKKQSLTSSTGLATTAAYYNFTTKTFSETFSNKLAKIKSNGADHHGFTLPTADASTRYDIVIEAAGVAPLPTIDASIAAPVANSITQHGRGVLTVKPTKLVNSSYATVTGGDDGAATLKTIKRAIRYDGDKYVGSKRLSIDAICSTRAGATDTRLVLNKPNPNILSGMIVSGGSVAHGTTVKNIANGVITLSRTAAVAADTSLSFTSSNTNLVPFLFNIAPSSPAVRINIPSGDGVGDGTKYPIGGLEAVSILTDGGISAGDLTMVLDNVQGLAVGMSLSGSGVQLDSDGNQPTITGITNSTTIELSSVQSAVLDNTLVTFGVGASTSGTRLHSIRLDDNGDDVDVSGYIEVGEVYGSVTLPIDLDTLLTFFT
jgi:hypothetical protein